MERAEFIHLLRLSEQACSEDSAAYRRGVALFAALGYAWVIGCLLLACALLYWSISAMAHHRFRGSYVWALIGGAYLLFTSARALWHRFDNPGGVELKPQDAPPLFEALHRIRKKIKGPPIHRVWLTDEFNASITQLPRYGLLGGAVNHLSIGLPMLLAIDRSRLLAVLAHEYGHLRGDHGRFAAWIYRTRLSWARLEHGLRNDQGIVGLLTQSFLRWYFPRFAAKTFALARQDEYEADKIAAKLLGADTAGAALIEIDLKGAWLAQEFWRDHWSAAAHSTQPLGPYAMMHKLLSLPLPEPFARTTLRKSLRRISDLADTHPVLRDRLEALDARAELPSWSTRSSLGLLGAKASDWLTHFDEAWRRDHTSEWKHQHAHLGRLRARIDALNVNLATRNATELAELGNLHLRLDSHAQVRSIFERAVELVPQHGAGLRGLISSLLPQENALRLEYLSRLFEHSPDYRWWACDTVVSLLEQPSAGVAQDTRALTLWRERLKNARAAEERAWEELADEDFLRATSAHDLSEFESEELQSQLTRCGPVTRAWLACKKLREFPSRRAYLLFVELPRMADEDRLELCQQLGQTLGLPGPVFVLWTHPNLTPQQIERQTRTTIYIKTLPA